MNWKGGVVKRGGIGIPTTKNPQFHRGSEQLRLINGVGSKYPPHHLKWAANRQPSPNHAHIVLGYILIGAQQSHILDLALGNQQSIKWVIVVVGQAKHLARVTDINR